MFSFVICNMQFVLRTFFKLLNGKYCLLISRVHIFFQELKAQYEVHNNIHNEAGSAFESAMRIIPVSDEMLQRQFHAKLEDRWRGVADRINGIQTSIIQNLSSQDVPFSDKLSLLEQELQEVKATIDEVHGVIKNEEELNLYIERLQVMSNSVCLYLSRTGGWSVRRPLPTLRQEVQLLPTNVKLTRNN
jgi:hypothetical protein